MSTNNQLNVFAWSISSAAVLLAVITWGQSYDWQFNHLSSYTLFPLFGLVAFSLMWAHYVVAAVRVKTGLEANVTKQYFEITSFLVLLAILLHPGLLIWQLWRDGLGLPPNSYFQYVGQSMRVAVTLGSISLAIFLVYELRHYYNKRWWWKYVQYASDVAMVAIFIHALRLGQNLQTGWYRWIWLLYGLTFGVSLYIIYTTKPTDTKKLPQKGS